MRASLHDRDIPRLGRLLWKPVSDDLEHDLGRPLPPIPSLNFRAPSFVTALTTLPLLKPRPSCCCCGIQRPFIPPGFPHTIPSLWNHSCPVPPFLLRKPPLLSERLGYPLCKVAPIFLCKCAPYSAIIFCLHTFLPTGTRVPRPANSHSF